MRNFLKKIENFLDFENVLEVFYIWFEFFVFSVHFFIWEKFWTKNSFFQKKTRVSALLLIFDF